jgi:hypothetical protein
MQVARGEDFRRVCNDPVQSHLRASAERGLECGGEIIASHRFDGVTLGK